MLQMRTTHAKDVASAAGAWFPARLRGRRHAAVVHAGGSGAVLRNRWPRTTASSRSMTVA